MRRFVLVHWNLAEAEERAARLRSFGHEVAVMHSQDIGTMQALRDDPPDAFVRCSTAKQPARSKPPRDDQHVTA